MKQRNKYTKLNNHFKVGKDVNPPGTEKRPVLVWTLFNVRKMYWISLG